MSEPASESLPLSKKTGRLLSLDALRGFDMFWIIGGQSLFPALFTLTGWGIWKTLQAQSKHAEWHGFTFEDLIFPLFIFLSGVTLGLSSKKMQDLGRSKRIARYRHAVVRLLLLVGLGVLFNHGWGRGLPSDVSDIRFASVLGRIGVAWFIAAMVVWHCSRRTQLIVAMCILFGYWMLLMFIPVPGHGAGVLTHEGTWNAWVDQHFLPGRTYRSRPYDPEGLLAHLPASVNAMFGAIAGCWLTDRSRGELHKSVYLFGAGLALLLSGWLWHPLFPVNKEIWTSSFVLVTCGWGGMLLAVFYYLIDVLGMRWLGWPFAVIGANAILIYLSGSFIDWSYMYKGLLSGFVNLLPEDSQPVFRVLSILALKWLLLLWLYRKRLFVRV